VTPAAPLVCCAGVGDVVAGGTACGGGAQRIGKVHAFEYLGTLDTPSGGSVRVAGVDPFTLSAKELAAFRSRSIGFIFQDHHLLPQCTALENVLLPRLALGKTTEEDQRRAVEILGQVGWRIG